MKLNKEDLKNYVRGLKFWLERARGYALWLNVLMIFDIWRGEKIGWGLAILFGIPSLISILFIDYKWIFPGEAKASTIANPEWVEKWNNVMNELNNIKKMLKAIDEQINNNKSIPRKK